MTSLVQPGGDIRDTSMPSGSRHDDGWFGILWRLCGDMVSLVAELAQATGCNFEILQVMEKFGGLRFQVNHANDAIREHIEAAKLESLPGGAFAELEFSLAC